ncbi:MAG: VCBS repeat-containing protein [Flavobacteriaceae bacterium]
MNRNFISFICLLVFLGCKQNEGELFYSPSENKTGITFANMLTESDDLNILDYLYFYNGGGVAIGDINNDSLPDIYLSGNQVKNKLYLNKGELVFEDITEQAGVAGNSSWNTGAVMGDVNGDGLLDIYVCAVVGLKGFNGYNELFINNGDGTFSEKAADYGLDFDSYSSSAAFLDYDQDGDLDIFLLNHAVHTQDSFGKAELRYRRNYQTGDKLLRNDGDRFVEVSEEAGIYGGINGYGLGVAISDFNQDGYPDIYVGNDFHEDDYYYINNTDGTFTESLRDYFGYSTRFSMGNDVADINHDGWNDIISLDMLPEDEIVLKSSEGDDNIQTQRLRIDRFGYHYQFTRNMLHLNRQDAGYAETALSSGIAATDWSWSALFADYNQDGEQDIFISNGIPKRPNDLDFINFVSNEQIKKKINNTKLVDQQALEMMPSGNTYNYIFKGTDSLRFEDKSGSWITKDTLISAATAIADLDNDGDLDIVTNNINSPARLYVNKTDDKASYLKIRFDYTSKNKFGIGTKVYSYHNGVLQYKELYTVRGFQASSEPVVHFGYGNASVVDSLRIVWPDKSTQLVKEVKLNQTITLKPENTSSFDYKILKPLVKKWFRHVEGDIGIDFTHSEDHYIDFNRQKLIPYQVSDRGPAIAVGDLNDDGKKDIYFGTSRSVAPRLFFQADSTYIETRIDALVQDSVRESVIATIADFDGNEENDLVIGVGGADFFNEMEQLLNTYYLQKEGVFINTPIPESFHNASVMKPCDVDDDGDLDLFVGNQSVSNDFGNTPTSFLLKNEAGQFTVAENQALNKAGMITDAIWHDFDTDGDQDLVVVGEWMSPKFFSNEEGQLKEVILLEQELNGLWQSIEAFDIDQDGDQDLILGNWGNNSKFSASTEHPLRMYYSDFDENGSTETVVAIFKDKNYYPIEDLDGLAGQMIGLKKKFTRYRDFAGKTVEEIIDKPALKKAKLLEVHELRSGYLQNDQGKFSFIPFQKELQIAPITNFLVYDFNGDGSEEVLAGGNYFGVKPYHGRFGRFPGAVISAKNEVILGHRIGLDFMEKSLRHLNIIYLNGQAYLLATFNNERAQVYELINNNNP